jgi:hypothetical protein
MAPDGGQVDGGRGTPDPDAGWPALYPGPLYFQLASGDLNGDGMLDLVAGFWSSNYASNQPLALQSSGFLVLFGLSDGGLASPLFFDGGADGVSFVVTDLNGDGLADVAATNNGQLSVYLSTSSSLMEPLSLSGGASLTGVTAGEFRQSGHIDLVEQGADGGLILFPNPGNGAFSSATAQSIDLPQSEFFGWDQVHAVDVNQNRLS